jgi:K+-sensing histidine kinase KdpD
MASNWHDLSRRARRAAAAADKGPLASICGLVAPLAVTVSLVPARASLAGTAAALILVAVIAAVAISGTRVAGIVASVSSGLCFDFFLTRPYERLAISHRADLETTVSLFVVGLIVTELAARGRHHRRVAVEESDYVELIYELAEMVSSGEPAAQVIDRASAELTDLLHLRGCRYERSAPGPHRTTVLSDCSVVHGGFLWGVSTMGLPGKEIDLPVHYGGRMLGRFVLVPTPGWPVSHERMIVAVAISGQAGAALATRARIA